MKLKCGDTHEEWMRKQKRWHPFFAIWPRRVAANDCRCFEWIERRREYMGYNYWHTEFRAKSGD